MSVLGHVLSMCVHLNGTWKQPYIPFNQQPLFFYLFHVYRKKLRGKRFHVLLFPSPIPLFLILYDLFIYLSLYLFIYLFIQAVPGLSCGTQDLRCGMRASQLWHSDFQLRHSDSQLWRACRIQFPDQGLNPGPLHWEYGVLPTGPPGKSLCDIFNISMLHLFQLMSQY